MAGNFSWQPFCLSASLDACFLSFCTFWKQLKSEFWIYGDTWQAACCRTVNRALYFCVCKFKFASQGRNTAKRNWKHSLVWWQLTCQLGRKYLEGRRTKRDAFVSFMQQLQVQGCGQGVENIRQISWNAELSPSNQDQPKLSGSESWIGRKN